VRLFVAVTPPRVVLDELETEVARLRALDPGLRWVPREQWHLTLAFLGEVGGSQVEELSERLGRAAARHPQQALRFTAAGRFGDRVLYTRVDGDLLPLRRLADSAAAAARRTGVATEDRRYRPHLTLARASGPGHDLRPLAQALAGFRGEEWTADQVHLVRSMLGAGAGGRPVHEIVQSWPLIVQRNGR
jgi:2'-5' RNA ligase